MEMTSDEAIRHLGTYSSTMGSGQTTQAQHEDAKRVAISTMQKYQQLQAEYETHLKADMEAVLKKLYGKLKMIHERYSTAEHWDEAYGVEISMEEVRKKINDLRGKDGD